MSKLNVKESPVVTIDSIDSEVYSTAIHVLIVEDDPVYVSLLSRLVRSSDKYTSVIIDSCGRNNSSFNYHTSVRYDILLVSQDLQDMLCDDLFAIVQPVGSELALPVIVLSNDQVCAMGSEGNSNIYDHISKSRVNSESLARSMNSAIVIHRFKKLNLLRVKELERLKNVISERDREIAEFYETISHEVKTPLAATREFVSIVKDGLVGELCAEQKELLEYALDGCDQLAVHFNNLCEITCLEKGKKDRIA